MKTFNKIKSGYLFVLLIFITSLLPVSGQVNDIRQDTLLYRVYYDCIHKYDKKDTANKFITESVLMIGQTKTRFSDVKFDFTDPVPAYILNPPTLSPEQIKKIESDRPQGTRQVTLTISNRTSLNEVLYQFINENKLILIGKLGYNDYKVEMNVPDIAWEILPDVKNFQGIQCQKARGTFGGRSYVVWFSPSLPFPYGPWKLGGLPGLILEATDDKNEIKFSVNKVIGNPQKNKFLYYEALRPIKLTEKAYNKEREKYFKDPIGFYKSQLTSNEMVNAIRYVANDGQTLKDGPAINAIKEESKIIITNPIEIEN